MKRPTESSAVRVPDKSEDSDEAEGGTGELATALSPPVLPPPTLLPLKHGVLMLSIDDVPSARRGFGCAGLQTADCSGIPQQHALRPSPVLDEHEQICLNWLWRVESTVER